MSASDDDLSKLLSSASLVFAATIIGSFASLFERVVISRLLSPDGYGEFSVAFAIFSLAATVGVAGFTQGVPRFMARFDSEEDIRGAWLTGLLLTSLLSISISIALLLISPFIISRLFESDEAFYLFITFAVSIPLLVSLKIGISAIRGKENTSYKVLTRDIGYRISRIILIAVFLRIGVGLVGTALGYFFALVLVNLVAYSLLNRLLPLRGNFNLHTKEMVLFSLPLVVSTVMSMLITNTDTVMLGFFRSSSEVGVYNAAYPLATTLTVILGAFGYMYLPLASRLDIEEGSSVERVYEVTTKWVFLLVFPLFLLLVSFSSEIVSLVFGPEYTAAGAALSILAVGFFTNAAVGRNRETLSALGATTSILVSNVIAFVLNLVLNLVLIPRYGFMGAAVASASSYFALNVVVYVFLRYQFGITPFNRWSLRSFVVLPLLFGPPTLLIGQHIDASPLFVAVYGIILVPLIIFVVAIIGGLEAEDEVIIDFLEDVTGLDVPYIRRHIPDP